MEWLSLAQEALPVLLKGAGLTVFFALSAMVLGLTLGFVVAMVRLAKVPLVAPLVGTLGAFATGSNTNSNILFGQMQKGVAALLGISPLVLLAAQTTGGALGSMISPAKLAVGGSTNAMKGKEGAALRLTLPIGLASTLFIGLLAWILLKVL